MRSKVKGVTLLELMTAIAVLAVLAGLGVPAFTNIMRNSQIAAGSNDLIQALTLARSEALTRGRRVSVCALEDVDDDVCAVGDGEAWQNGWIAFEDEFGAVGGELDPSDVVLQRWSAPVNGLEVIGVDAASGDGASAVTFMRNARAEFEVDFTVDKDGCTGDQERRIDVNFAGRVSLTRVACTED